jgi:predicted Rossmann fold nucleotide-binding protein DprA/Smf involved in DNA uptake
LITSPEEILMDFGGSPKKTQQIMQNLDSDEKQLVDSLTKESKHIDELCREFSLNPAQMSSRLIKMEIKGIVKNIGAGVYAKAV